MPHTTKAMQDCIDVCDECRQSCLETLTHCLEKGGKHSAAEHVQSLLDCAEACQTSANFMARGSALHAVACGVCADACDACAESCEAFKDDEEMQACAEVCRRCSESCHQMAGAVA